MLYTNYRAKLSDTSINKSKTSQLTSFDLQPGRTIARKYEVVEKLGQGWEGEVYKFREIRTGVELAAKMFFPHRDPKDKSVLAYARKLHKLRKCSMVTRYHTEEYIQFRGSRVTVLISEFVEGLLLETFIRKMPGKRLTPFMAIHLLHALSGGMDEIHKLGEYHGDLHTENIIVVKHGLNFELKLLDMYYWGKPRTTHMRDDTVDMIRLLYDVLGGQKYYAKNPVAIKRICCGLKRTLILRKFKHAGDIKKYLEELEW